MFTRIHISAAFILAASVNGLAQSGVDFRDAVKATTPAVVAVTLGLTADDDTAVVIGSAGVRDKPLRWYRVAPSQGEMRLYKSGTETEPMRAGFAVADDLVISWNLPGDAAQITMIAHDGRKLTGQVVARDHVTDLVAIRIEQGSLNGLTLAGVAPEAGLPVLVSWLRDARTFISYASMIATHLNADESRIGFSQRLDGDFTPQTSGAPVVDASGRVVGVLVMRDSNVPICLPPITVARLIKAASASEPVDVYRGRIGIHLDGEEHAVVAKIADDSPAKAAELEVGDKVTKVGGFACGKPSDVMAAVAMSRAGEELRFEIQRGNERIERIIKLTSVEPETKPKPGTKVAVGQQLFQLKDGRLVAIDEKDKGSAIGKALEWLNKNNQAFKQSDVVVPLDVDALNGRMTLRVERSRLEDSFKKLESQKSKQDEMIKQLREKISRMEVDAKAMQDREVARLEKLVEEIKERIQSERSEEK